MSIQIQDSVGDTQRWATDISSPPQKTISHYHPESNELSSLRRTEPRTEGHH